MNSRRLSEGLNAGIANLQLSDYRYTLFDLMIFRLSYKEVLNVLKNFKIYNSHLYSIFSQTNHANN
jgi:hypothetical protein